MVTRQTLEAKVSSIFGKEIPEQAQDVAAGLGSVKWVSALWDKDFFCQILQAEIDKNLGAGLPSTDWIASHGGFIAHLALKRLESGLVYAEIHNQNHYVILYPEEIYECRGLKAGKPDTPYPMVLKGLVRNDFSLSIESAGFVTATGQAPSYTTTGVKGFSIEGNLGGTIVLTYSIQRVFSPALGDLTVPLLVTANVETRAANFAVAFGLGNGQGDDEKIKLEYGVRLSSGGNSFSFTADGKMRFAEDADKKSIQPAHQWMAFFAYFGSGKEKTEKVIDVPASIRKTIGLFAQARFPGKISLDNFVVYT